MPLVPRKVKQLSTAGLELPSCMCACLPRRQPTTVMLIHCNRGVYRHNVDVACTQKSFWWGQHKAWGCRLDCRNFLLQGVSDVVVRKVQSVRNAAARLITGTKRCDHVTPVHASIALASCPSTSDVQNRVSGVPVMHYPVTHRCTWQTIFTCCLKVTVTSFVPQAPEGATIAAKWTGVSLSSRENGILMNLRHHYVVLCK